MSAPPLPPLPPPSPHSHATSQRQRVLRFLKLSVAGAGVASVPVLVWWYWARQERQKIAEDVATRLRIPGQETTDDFLIEKCRPGDVLVFDRRWETCASGPGAALACIVSKALLCRDDPNKSVVAQGHFDHIGLIVPGFVKNKQDALDPSNLLLMEATPQGIVARPLKTRLEYSQARSVVLMQLNVPGGQRDFKSTNYDDDDDDEGDDDGDDNDENNSDDDKPLTSRQVSARRSRRYVERQLVKFRDTWLALGEQYHFGWWYSTLTVGGALAYGTGLHAYLSGPVSPSAWLVLLGLQQAAAAHSIHERNELWQIKTSDFLTRLDPHSPLRLRPGWRFLAPIALRDNHT